MNKIAVNQQAGAASEQLPGIGGSSCNHHYLMTLLSQAKTAVIMS